MPIFEKCPKEIGEIVNRISEKFHPDLHNNSVTVELLFACPSTNKNGDKVGIPLKENGFPVPIAVGIVPYKGRVLGLRDAIITIDRDQWDDKEDDQKSALVDRALEFLQVAKDRDGNVKTDDKGRPKLFKRLPDRNIAWFDRVARHWGPAAEEVVQFQDLITKHRQLWLMPSEGETLPVGESNGTNGEHAAKALPEGHPRKTAAKASENGDGEKPARAPKFSEPAMGKPKKARKLAKAK